MVARLRMPEKRARATEPISDRTADSQARAKCDRIERVKRLTVAVVLAVCLAAPVWALDGSIDAGLGATFEFGDNVVTADPTTDPLTAGFSSVLNVLTALRIGGFLDATVTIAGPLSFGGEIGIFGFVGSDEQGNATLTPLIDAPVRGFLRLSLGFLTVQGHVGTSFGTFIDLSVPSGIGFQQKIDLGVRVAFDALYVEWMQLFWDGDRRSTRVGLGLFFRDLVGGDASDAPDDAAP